MPEFDFDKYVPELDAAEQAHLEWSHRILRCAVLRTLPDDDVFLPDAHVHCQFGGWLMAKRPWFEALDSKRTAALISVHQAMHDAIRGICLCMQDGLPGSIEDLDAFESSQSQLIEHLAHFKSLAMSLHTQLDALTGLPLRHRMQMDYALMAKRGRLHDVLMVMMVDVDHFKAINDQHGHAAGDIVLRHIAATLKTVLRDEDLIYRYGGEEFVLMMRVSPEPLAQSYAAKRLLQAVRAQAIALATGVSVRPTVTIGIAVALKGEGLASVIQRADRAMYAGKASGRDQFVVDESPQ